MSRAKRVAIVRECPHGKFLPHRKWWRGWCHPGYWIDTVGDLNEPLYTFETQYGSKGVFTRQNLIDSFKRSGARE